MKLHLDNHQLDYLATQGKSPCVIFCPGFNSNKQGDKALALEAFCIEQGQAFIRFDYSGHGVSGGDFADSNVSHWLTDTLAIIDQITKQNVLLIGSSMGGWISLLAALLRPKRVVSLLLLACAADMTKYYPERLSGMPAKKDALGRIYYSISNEYDDQQPYSIYQHLINDGANHYLLDKPIELTIPVRLVHGMQDDVVPWRRSQAIIESLQSLDASLHLIKSGDHRLSKQEDIAIITYLLKSLL